MFAVAALVLAGCGATGEPDLEVGTARSSPRISGAAQIVLDVTNHGDGDDTLSEVTTPAAVGTEIHLTTLDDGRATMEVVDDVPIPAGETTSFRPGGLHLMLTVPDETVEVGGTFELTLRFERTGEITVPVQVVENHELLEPPDDGAEEPDTDAASLGPDGEPRAIRG